MTDIPAEVLEMHRLHIEEGMTCKRISELHGHDDTWCPRIFRRYGLPYNGRHLSKLMANIRGEIDPDELPPEQMRVRLAIRDGVYHVFEIDQDGNRLGRGVPASPYEIALWRECRKWIKQVV